jgi:hypothetical protein
MPTSKGYLATDEQVAALAKEYVASATSAENARGTYLRILLAHALRELHKGSHKRHTAAEALGAIETAHSHLYTVVTEATLTPDVTPDPDASDVERRRRTQERNRRTNFARSSKSDLTNFVKAGGRLVTLTPETVSRDELRRFARAAREGPKALPDRVASAVERLETLVRQLMEQDPDGAREVVEGLQLELQTIVTPPKRMAGKRKVGNITLHAEQ